MNPLLAQQLTAAESEGTWAAIQAFFLSNPWAVSLLLVLIVGKTVPGMVSLLVWVERRGAALIQDRLGPNRVGPFGILQSIADLVKFVFKEDVLPGHVNKPIFLLSPALAVIPPFIVLAFIPFGENVAIADVDTGILACLAFSSLHVYSISLGGWSSNSKYPLLGGVRAAAQMISYEIALGISALSVFVVMGDLRLTEVVRLQTDGLIIAGTTYDAIWAKVLDWNIWKQPLGAIIFLIAGFAETNRHPFDMPEAESELAAGYHTEFSSMKFALFFLGEYAAMIVISSLFIVMYLGGWTLFGVENLLSDWVAEYGAANPGWVNWPLLVEAHLHVAIFLGKLAFLLWLFIWVRWSLPRFRYDQLMSLGWKRLLPISLLWFALTAVAVALVR